MTILKGMHPLRYSTPSVSGNREPPPLTIFPDIRVSDLLYLDDTGLGTAAMTCLPRLLSDNLRDLADRYSRAPICLPSLLLMGEVSLLVV